MVETVLGHQDQLGLEVATVVAEPTMAPHSPLLAELVPKHEPSRADAHGRARRLAATIATATAA